MPRYPWLFENTIDVASTGPKIEAMTTLGVPYPARYAEIANDDLMRQAEDITADLKTAGIETSSDKEIIALIAYLQRLGTDIYAEK